MATRKLASDIEQILSHIEHEHNFLLSGGAGSGKTYSLVEVLKHISIIYPNKPIACITYTNAAANEIKSRTNVSNLKVATIHDFLWENIRSFDRELKSTLIELVNVDNSCIKNPEKDTPFILSDDVSIRYEEYTRIKEGIISHNEVLCLANAMYKKHPKLCTILKDKFPFIFIDEYQDTSPLVIEIFLEFLHVSTHKNIIGFFGDSMQAIYDEGVGDIEKYILQGFVYKVEKSQNRRNPETVIKLANKLRLDQLKQTASDDMDAPNMLNGKLRTGTTKFLYSEQLNLTTVKETQWFRDWNFNDPEQTKELRLTHNLIANEVGFDNLMQVYDGDPICKFITELKKEIVKQRYTFDDSATFEEVVEGIDWKYTRGANKGKSHLEVLKTQYLDLYKHVQAETYEQVAKIYMNKDSLIDEAVIVDGVTIREAKRDYIIQHLFKIQDIIYLYESKMYHELLQKAKLYIKNNSDKRKIENHVKTLMKMKNSSIKDVIDFADQANLCKKDDRFNMFVEKNEYLYWRVGKIAFSEIQNLYRYIEGFTPFSTQHKIKGLEYKNVLVILSNGGWSKYNFEYLFDKNIESTLLSSKKTSYPKILRRTKKLFYVCCTRAMKNLVVYYPNPTQGVIAGAEELFGKENCIDLDEN